jgi:hypothetical protein
VPLERLCPKMTMTIKEACKAALKQALIATKPHVSVDENGYVGEVRETHNRVFLDALENLIDVTEHGE